MRASKPFACAAIAFFAGCTPLPPIELGLPVGPSRVLSILNQHQCDRCHTVESVFGAAHKPWSDSSEAPAGADLVPEPVPLEATGHSCTGCHRQLASAASDPALLAEGRERFGPGFDGQVERAASRYCHVPSLASMERFRESWLRDFLEAPHDVRPNLVESMIRPNLSLVELETLLAGWNARPQPELEKPGPSPTQLARGQALFDHKSCGTCHLFGSRRFEVASGWQFDQLPKVRLRALAPDLRHARRRLTRQTLEAWIFDPASVKPTAAMPRLSMTRDEAAALADFIAFADPGNAAKPSLRRPPPFDAAAPVPTDEEVEAKVFGPICRHCHGSPHLSDGDRGPGASGGFGFPGKGLSFQTAPGSGLGLAMLERLRARYEENERDTYLPGEASLEKPGRPATALRGMPLGLPALTPAQFSLVERWVRGATSPARPAGDPDAGSPRER